MSRRAMPVLVALLLGCSPNVGIQGDVHIRCETSADCPDERECHEALKVCLVPGTVLEDVHVVFSTPGNDEAGVSLSPTIVIAFNVDVDPASLDGLAHLTADGRAEVPLTSRVASSSAMAFTPAGELTSKTRYTFALDVGARPAPGVLAGVGTTPFQAGFTTTEAPDREPPARVKSATVTVVDKARLELKWELPADTTIAGVLIVRTKGAAVAASPVNGTTYAVGAEVGNGEVIAVTHKASWSDVSVEPDVAYGYAFYAFDAAGNYAAPALPPFVGEVKLLWCPTKPAESGTFQLSPAQPGRQWLEVADAVGATVSYPPAPDTFGAATTLAADHGLALGTKYSARPHAANDDGEWVGAPRTFWLSRRDLAPVVQPLQVGLNGTASFEFTPSGWASVEGEVDTDVNKGVEAFAPVTVAAGATTVTAKMTKAGDFRFGVRPVEPGCPAADWITSAEFHAGGNVFYVREGASGDGTSPTSPAGKISTVLTPTTPNDSDIYVAGGTYSESVTMQSRVRLMGGWSPDFREQDGPLLDAKLQPIPRKYETKIAPVGVSPTADRRPLVLKGAAVDGGALVDNVTAVASLAAACSAPTTAECEARSVSVEAGAAPRLTNVHAAGAAAGSGSAVSLALYTAGSSPDIAGSFLEGGSTVSGSTSPPRGLLLGGCPGGPCAVKVSASRVVAHLAIEAAGGLEQTPPNSGNYNTQLTVDGAWVETDARTRVPATEVVFQCDGGAGAGVTFTRSRLYAHTNTAAFLGSDGAPSQASRVFVVAQCRIRAEANRIFGGDGGEAIVAEILGPGAPFDLVSNLVVTGSAGGTCGLQVWNTGGGRRITVTGNTVYVSARNPLYAALARFSNSFQGGEGPDGTFVANLVFSGAQTILFSEGNGWATAVQHNAFLNPPPAAYYQALSGKKTTVADMEAYLCGRALSGNDNVALALAPADVFVSAGGADGKLETLEDNDWHLNRALLDPASAGAKLAGGGIDASKSVCIAPCPPPCTATPCPPPPTGTGYCGAVTTDFDGKPRSAPFSIGAYELD